MKIPFDIKWKPQIESGEYKVENREGRPVRIICWDKKSEKKYGYHIVGLVEFGPLHEESAYYTIDGKGRLKDKEPELFVVTPEEEMTEFERQIENLLNLALPEGHAGTTIENTKRVSTELLEMAKKEFVKSGYVIEKKAFHDAVEKIDDKHKAAMSVEYSLHCKVENGTRHAVMNWNEFQKVAQHFIDCGKAEALKDLPRWKPAARAYEGDRLPRIDWLSKRLVAKFEEGIFYLDMNDLYKLPGFNEK